MMTLFAHAELTFKNPRFCDERSRSCGGWSAHSTATNALSYPLSRRTALSLVNTATFLSSDAAKPRVVHLNRRVVSLSSTLAAES